MKIMFPALYTGVTPGLHEQGLINSYIGVNIMESFEIVKDNGPALAFDGELLAKVSSNPNVAYGSSYSGEVGRWQVLALYKTQGGKFICERINRTQWQGERDKHNAKVCASNKEVIEFFGHSWLAKDLYYEAGINAAERID